MIRRPGLDNHGFSLLETSLVLAVVGVLALAGFSLYREASGRGAAAAAMRERDRAAALLDNFVQVNFRLPCPDTDGDGYEETNCPDGVVTGAFPYESVGGGDGLASLFYAVYRNRGAAADLAVARDRTGDGAVDLDDFRQALVNAAAAPVSADHPYATGDGAGTGAEDCDGNQVANAAWWLVRGGLDADGDGSPFDGANHGLRRDGSGGLCLASPARRRDPGYDDVVSGEPFVLFLGRLRRTGEGRGGAVVPD